MDEGGFKHIFNLHRLLKQRDESTEHSVSNQDIQIRVREIEKAIDELFLNKKKDASVDEASRVEPVDKEVVDKPSLGKERVEHKPLEKKILGKTRVFKVPGLVSLQGKKFFEDEKRFFQEKLFGIKKSAVDLFFGKKELGSRLKVPFHLSFSSNLRVEKGGGKTERILPVFKLPKLSDFRREKTFWEEKEVALKKQPMKAKKPDVFLSFEKGKYGDKVSKVLSHLPFKQSKRFSSEIKEVEETEDSEDLPSYPLVDLSMKDLLKKRFPLEDSEEKKPDVSSATEDVYETSDSGEEFIEHTFFDEDDPFFFANASSVPIDGEIAVPPSKVDLGDVELPREALRFEPSVEFKPPTQLEEINVPVASDKFEEIDFYPVYEPFAYIKILRDKDTLEKIYAVLEPELSEKEMEIYGFINETLSSTVELNFPELEEISAGKYIERAVNQIISDYELEVEKQSKYKILYLLKKETIGYGKIDALMRDPNIEDISCDGSSTPIFVYHRKHGSLRTNIGFDDEEELSSFVIRLAQKCGKHISIAEPMLDATLPDGSRIQMTLSTEITTKGSTFTIRKFRTVPYSPAELVEMNTLSPEILAYLWLAVEHGANGIFAGGTASGKTTTLNAIALFIPREAKIVSIEETRELNLPHPNWIPGVTRIGFGEVVADKVIGEIDMYDLMKAALRQRPEYILVGEIRGKEAYVLFQAMATGHTTYSTMHADSPQSLIHRLEGKPINIPRVMIQSLDFVCFQSTTRIKDKRERRVTQVIEIIDIDPRTKELIMNEVFSWDSINDTFRYSGRSYLLEEIRAKLNISKEQLQQELNNRIKIINWTIKKRMHTFREVSQVINEYADNPDELIKRIDADA